jgi:ribosomal protein S12 methylthiotransferase
MVGFPGESAEEFHELVQLVERVQFDHLGVFAFSSEPGSRAAKMPDQVSRATKAKRQRELLARQREISARRLTRLVGRTLTVLVEGVHPESDLLLAGRLAIQAPEVDGIAIITRGDARVGEFRSMRVSAVHDYDVVGELADAPPAAAG